MSFLGPAVITDPFVLAANAKAFLEAELPGWHAADGSIECLIIDAYSFPAAEQAESLEVNLVAAYKSLGVLQGIPPLAAIPATASATFTLTDTAGHTLTAANTIIGVRNSSNELQTFRLIANLVVAPGSSTGTATVEATEAGAAGNNLTGAAELVSAEPFIASATIGTSGGGSDEEEEETYLSRLTEDLAIQKPGPVLAVDAAVVARSVASVGRATAVDNLRPAAADGGESTEATGQEKMVTVACTNADGTPSSAGVLAEVLAVLNALRETSFKYFVIKPHYMKIDVTTNVACWPGANLATVKTEVKEALELFLSPARWASDQSRHAANWRNDPEVRLAELMAAVSAVPGVRYVTELTFGKHGGTLAKTNVNLGASSVVPALPDVLGNADGTSTPATFTITTEATT